MEQQRSVSEQYEESLKRRSLKFGNKVVDKVLEGQEVVVLNPRLGGLGGYRSEAVYPYIQSRLQEVGIETKIVSDLIESGSEKQIPRDRLIVKQSPDPSAEA